MKIEDIYFKSPRIVQSVFLNIYAYKIKHRRFGKDFKKYYKYFRFESDYNKVDINSLSLFLDSANKTRFWNKRFSKYKVDITNTDNILEEIKKMPILGKQEVKDNFNDIKNLNVKENFFNLNTSGTTGSGLSFPQTHSMEQKQWAIWYRYRNWHEVNFNTWMGWFGGRSIIDINQKKPPYWHINFPMKQIMFSAYHLNENSVYYYYNQIKKQKLGWLHGYPSQIYFLANLVRDNNLGILPDLKIISVGSEKLFDYQKDTIEETFKVKVIQHYGLAEGVANISELVNGKLVPDQDFCYTEFIPLDKNDKNTCKIIGTNYSNLAFPLIRYDTGDIAKLYESDDSIEIISIDGRIEDYIILPNGVKLGRLDHIFKKIINVRESQIYQPNSNRIVIKVVKGKKYNDKDEKLIMSEAKKRIGDILDISIEYCDYIPKSKNGKLRFVISEVK